MTLTCRVKISNFIPPGADKTRPMPGKWNVLAGVKSGFLLWPNGSEEMRVTMYLIDQIAEARIQEAMDQGELRGLPGEGQPLLLDDDSAIPEELRAAYRLLKNAGFLPPELQWRRELREAEQSPRKRSESRPRPPGTAATPLGRSPSSTDESLAGRSIPTTLAGAVE